MALKADDQLYSLARELHLKLFPEEYDYIYDSNFDASVRRNGKNPMNESYVQKTNLRRSLLGFSPLRVGHSSQNVDTLAWVKEALVLGREAELFEIIANLAREDAGDE
jgi:hypothetical protein